MPSGAPHLKLPLLSPLEHATTTGISSAFDSIYIAPRTPKTSRVPHSGRPDELQMGLLNAEERQQANQDLDSMGEFEDKVKTKEALSAKDKGGMVLLSFLYLIQGIPLGLALGSVPFLLQKKLSYSQLATFALSNYPYTLKLLWSPIVDSVFFKRVGRRKSWIIPMQFCVGSQMLYISLNAKRFLEDPAKHLIELTIAFTLLVTFAATQDIAVDGWALTLLSPETLSYASTCQTIGLKTGYFVSFTIFLTFNSETFSEKWGIPRLSLGGYLKFWSMVCYIFTLWLIFIKQEDKEPSSGGKLGIKVVYRTIWTICMLKHVQLLIIMQFFARVGFAANDSVTSLKLVEKGLKREELAFVVMIDFPFQMLGSWLAGRMAKGPKPLLRPFIHVFWPRLMIALLAAVIVYKFPRPPISNTFFVAFVIHTIISSFTQTLQFVGFSAFHNRISDPLIGGTYMTLLNTIMNTGGQWPKWFVLKGVDILSVAKCQLADSSMPLSIKASECVSQAGKELCTAMQGQCLVERDGYYVVSALCVTFGVIFTVSYIVPTARKLQDLPISSWRVL